MKNVSALENIHKHGLFGNHDSKDELINIREIKDVLIYQIVKYKKSSISIDKIKIDNLNLPQTLLVSSNHNTRILWMGPDNWLVVSKNKEIEKSIFFETNPFSETSAGIVRPSNSGPATCPISILNVDKASVP